MHTEDSAHAAPQGSFAHSPTGFRRMTPGLLKADRAAEKFNGLPKGLEKHGQLLAAVKAAAPRLGLSPRLVHAIDHLFCHTKPQDWKADSRPIVWPSNETLRLALALERSQLKDVIRRLIELGLVTMKDSPNGKRYGNRDKAGRITEAYGFDLSLFAVRHAEFVRLSAELDAERRAMKKLRRRRTIAHKGIIQILETAREYGFGGDEWQTLSRETRDLVASLKDVDRPDEMEAGVKSLERRWNAARERIELLLGTVDSDPKEPENRPHYNNYNPPVNLKEDTVIAAKGCSSPAEPPSPQAPAQVPERTSPQAQTPARTERTDRGMVDRVSADELVRLAPRLRQYLRRPDPTWPDIVDAADWLRDELGISKSAWGEACRAMGRDRAAVAVALITTKEPGHIKNPGGYFREMLRRDMTGDLHLDWSIYGLRGANNPEWRAKRQRSRRSDAHNG
jgi:replication initiation protein RepC